MQEVRRVYYVAVFEDRGDAELAARDLRERGFKDDQIGYAWRDESGKTQGTKAGKLAAEGAGAGVVLGGIIGAAAGLLIPGVGPIVAGGILATALAGAVTGAVAGGVAGALVGLGIPEDEARYYEDEFGKGRTLLTVKAGDRYDEVSDIARRRRGYDYATRSDRALDENERYGQEASTRTR
jgi:hypothetical protein